MTGHETNREEEPMTDTGLAPERVLGDPVAVGPGDPVTNGIAGGSGAGAANGAGGENGAGAPAPRLDGAAGVDGASDGVGGGLAGAPVDGVTPGAPPVP